MGRPKSYTSEIAESILTKLADGKSLRRACAEIKYAPNPATVRRWIVDNLDGFRDKYAIAKEEMLESWADDIVEIADESNRDTISTESGEHPNSEWINRSRLRVDTRKWLLSKLLPKKFGDKLAIGGDPDGTPVQVVVHRGQKPNAGN